MILDLSVSPFFNELCKTCSSSRETCIFWLLDRVCFLAPQRSKYLCFQNFYHQRWLFDPGENLPDFKCLLVSLLNEQLAQYLFYVPKKVIESLKNKFYCVTCLHVHVFFWLLLCWRSKFLEYHNYWTNLHTFDVKWISPLERLTEDQILYPSACWDLWAVGGTKVIPSSTGVFSTPISGGDVISNFQR